MNLCGSIPVFRAIAACCGTTRRNDWDVEMHGGRDLSHRQISSYRVEIYGNQGTRQVSPVVQAWIIIILIIGYESYCSEQCELDLYQHDKSDAYPCPSKVVN